MSPLDVVQKMHALASEVEQALNAENSRGGEARVMLDKLYRDVCADDVAIFGWEDKKLRARAERVWDRFVTLQEENDRLRALISSEAVSSDKEPVDLLEDSLGQLWEAGRRLLRDL